MAMMSIADAYKSAIAEEMRRDPSVFVLGEDEDIPGGMGGAFTVTKGIGDEFGANVRVAKENGFEQLNLEVRSDNARAIRLYEKYGFRKLCTFPHFFKINGEYIDFDLMNLELNTADNQVEENMK